MEAELFAFVKNEALSLTSAAPPSFRWGFFIAARIMDTPICSALVLPFDAQHRKHSVHRQTVSDASTSKIPLPCRASAL